MSILSGLKALFSREGTFKKSMAKLDDYDQKLSHYSRALNDLSNFTVDETQKKMISAHFFHTASLLKMVRHDYKKLADAYFSKPRVVLSINSDLQDVPQELELLEFLFSSANHPYPIIDRGGKLLKVFEQNMGRGAERYIQDKQKELSKELEL